MSTMRLISDFNIEVLGRYLENLETGRTLTVDVAPYGQVHQALAGSAAAVADPKADAMIWARAEGVLSGFRRAMNFEEISHDDVLREVDDFAADVMRYASSVRYLFVVNWFLPPGNRGYGLLDMRPGVGLTHLLGRMNARLAERCAEAPNIYLLDAEQWIRGAGTRASSPKMWYAGKVPFGNTVFELAAWDVHAALDALAGTSRRLIVLDLDGTLWGGVIGERGTQGIALGGHDHVGEAFVDFQLALKGLANRGIQLAIVSKNDESVALDGIDNHPDMVLRRRDFAGWKINWNDKARNVAELTEELNLGLASVVFLDDSAIERARVREAYPDVLVPEWPSDPAQYRDALMALRCFDTATVTREDRARGEMYAAERERRASRENVQSLDEWLKTLDIRVEAEPLTASNITRAAQLFNKTNQMNLATRRLSEAELVDWASDPNRRLWTISVSDKFGNAGLTGIVSVETEGESVRLVDFLLSCRVMGRKVEQTMLHLALDYAERTHASELVADLRPTARNAPCLAFFASTDFRREGEYRFVRDLSESYPVPECVTLVLPSDAQV